MSVYTNCKGFDLFAERVIYVGEIRDACSYLSAALGRPVLLDYEHVTNNSHFTFLFDDEEMGEKFFRVYCSEDETVDFSDETQAIVDGTEFSTELRATGGADVWLQEELEAFEEALSRIGLQRSGKYPKNLSKYSRR